MHIKYGMLIDLDEVIDLCSRKLGGTVILYNELKLFVSLNCFNVDYLLLNFSQSRLAVSL